ncbi:MAG: DMT family transporter [Chitinophagaceae bacterium]|nr:DMT family transporter [Chitinophagaceae bacterium]MBK8953104.1 DMT family transporter [Chitinophagaceae bacterium]
MQKGILRWGLFAALCIIWGSSFILMKWGMFDEHQQPVLSPFHVAALRMLSSGVVMLPFLYSSLKGIPAKTVRYILLSGWMGSFFPAFLFCIAETKIDGALTGSLNSLTPLFVIITGTLFFGMRTGSKKIAGVVVGLAGSALLIYLNITKPQGYISYTGFVVFATLLYGFNVNMVHNKLAGVSSVQIATIAFTGLIPPALIVLFATGYFNQPLSEHKFIMSTLASSILGIVGTAFASVLFYVLVKRAGGLFASLVTYGVPFVAIIWGVYYGENVTILQIVALCIILAGVYLANRSDRKK